MIKSNLVSIGVQVTTDLKSNNSGDCVSCYVNHVDGQRKNHTFLAVFKKNAVKKAKSISRGNNYLLTGELLSKHWENDGQKKSMVYINTYNIEETAELLKQNSVIFSGHTTKEPKVVQLNDKKVANMTIAYNKDNVPHYVGVEAWGELCQSCTILKKGALIQIYGKLVQKVWGQNNENSQVFITARSIDFVTYGKSSS